MPWPRLPPQLSRFPARAALSGTITHAQQGRPATLAGLSCRRTLGKRSTSRRWCSRAWSLHRCGSDSGCASRSPSPRDPPAAPPLNSRLFFPPLLWPMSSWYSAAEFRGMKGELEEIARSKIQARSFRSAPNGRGTSRMPAVKVTYRVDLDDLVPQLAGVPIVRKGGDPHSPLVAGRTPFRPHNRVVSFGNLVSSMAAPLYTSSLSRLSQWFFSAHHMRVALPV